MGERNRWRCMRQIAAALCVAVGLSLVGVARWTTQITASGRPHALWRAELPGIDVGLDASPATIGQDGAVELWIYPYNADDYLPLLWLPGASALIAPPRPQPGEVSS
jgi:hypothetical protein